MPLYGQGPQLMPLSFRLNAVKTIMPEKNTSRKNLILSLHEASKSLLHSNFFSTKGSEASRTIFPQKFGDTNGALNLHLNVVALLLSVVVYKKPFYAVPQKLKKK